MINKYSFFDGEDHIDDEGEDDRCYYYGLKLKDGYWISVDW